MSRPAPHYIAVDFIDVVKADGNLMIMADQVRRAVAWVYTNAASFGGDANRIYISGHRQALTSVVIGLLANAGPQ